MNKINHQEVISFIKDNLAKGNYVSIRQIAKVFNCDRKLIRYILKKHNLYDWYKETVSKISNNRQNIDIDNEKEITILKEEIKYWKSKYKKLLKESSYDNKLVQLFEETLERYSDTKKLLDYKVEFSDKAIEEEAILVLSDWHYGETVKSEQVLDLNEYDIDIAHKRITTIVSKFLSIVERFKDDKHIINKCSIFLLGDMCSGIIHHELWQDVPIADQVIDVGILISEIVYELSKVFKEVNVYGVSGNHSRIDKTIKYKDRYSNFDYLSYKIAEIKCENLSNVNFYIPKSSMIIVNKFDKWNFLLRHGDGKSQSYAGIPVYGIVRSSSKIQQIFSAYKDIYVHYQILGHFHANMQIPYPAGQVIVCGSLKGIDEFGFNNFLGGEVSQTMLMVNKDYGVYARLDLYPY